MNFVTLRIEAHANEKLGEAEAIIRTTIRYLRKNGCYKKANELTEAYIALHAIDIESDENSMKASA